MTPTCSPATAETPAIDLTQSDVSTTARARTPCTGVASADPLPDSTATDNSVNTGPSWPDTTSSRPRQCSVRHKDVDLMRSVLTTPASPASSSITVSSLPWRVDTLDREASTLRLQAPDQQPKHLSCRLDDTRWEVQEILEFEGDHARVDWAPARLAVDDLCKEKGGRPLLESIRRFEQLTDGLCHVHWLPTWEPCTELFNHVDPAGLVEESGRSLFLAPARILSERRRAQELDYLVNLKPTLLSSADVQRKRYLGDFDVKTIRYIGNDVWGIVWEPIWVSPCSDCGSLDWEDLWDDIHSEWILYGDGGRR